MKFTEEERVRSQKFKEVLAKKLGLDPNRTTNVRAEWVTGHDMVEVHWEGVNFMTVEDFEELMTEARYEL